MMFSNYSKAENLGLITSPIPRPSLHHLCPLTARYSYVTHWISWHHHIFHCTFIHRVTDLLLMPCALSGCDMPTAHHRSFIHYLPIGFVSFHPLSSCRGRRGLLCSTRVLRFSPDATQVFWGALHGKRGNSQYLSTGLTGRWLYICSSISFWSAVL